jgi:hypothetical protein
VAIAGNPELEVVYVVQTGEAVVKFNAKTIARIGQKNCLQTNTFNSF